MGLVGLGERKAASFLAVFGVRLQLSCATHHPPTQEEEGGLQQCLAAVGPASVLMKVFFRLGGACLDPGGSADPGRVLLTRTRWYCLPVKVT